MQAVLLGIKKVDFISKDNKAIKGKTIYVCFSEENTVGLATNHFYIRDDIALNAEIEDDISIDFDHKGRILAISKI